MQIEYLPVDAVKPYKRNTKKHTPEQVEMIARSIKEFGFRQPLVVDRDNVLIIGHGRLAAARLLGLSDVPCVRADDLTEEQVKALRIVDNKTNESAWDVDMLNFELGGILDIDMDAFGLEFSDSEFEHSQNRANAQRRVENILQLVNGQFPGVGKYDMPMMQPVTELPDIKEWISFNYVLSDKEPEGKAVHFFIDDYQFERVWNNPERYLDKLSRYACVATPDFSPYSDMPMVCQMFNHYRKQWMGAYWQSQGLTVIPTIRPVARGDWWLDGIPKNGIYITSAMWSKPVTTETDETAPWDKIIIDKLKPRKVFMYAGDGDNLYRHYGIDCEYIKSFTQKRWK